MQAWAGGDVDQPPLGELVEAGDAGVERLEAVSREVCIQGNFPVFGPGHALDLRKGVSWKCLMSRRG